MPFYTQIYTQILPPVVSKKTILTTSLPPPKPPIFIRTELFTYPSNHKDRPMFKNAFSMCCDQIAQTKKNGRHLLKTIVAHVTTLEALSTIFMAMGVAMLTFQAMILISLVYPKL
jgi:hypothetical protein